MVNGLKSGGGGTLWASLSSSAFVQPLGDGFSLMTCLRIFIPSDRGDAALLDHDMVGLQNVTSSVHNAK